LGSDACHCSSNKLEPLVVKAASAIAPQRPWVVICEPPPPVPYANPLPPVIEGGERLFQRVRVILYGTRCDRWFGPHCRCNLDLAVAVI
jgi:hypothetical protein